jgi:hypothetical protein
MEQRKRALVGECISRASVEAARAATVADIDVATAACDYERAATIAFARARAGSPVGTDVIARILPGIELPAIACSLIAIAPSRADLIALLDARRFPNTKDAAELEAIVLYAAWKAGADTARVIPHVRRLSARSLTAESYALLATIAASLDDSNVVAATKPIAPFAKEYAKHVALDDKAMHASLDAVMAELPPEVELSAAAGFTVRAAKTAGRNDPCPCGSGQKFKKCCADKPQAAPSPIPGVSWDAFLAGDRVTPAHVEELPLKDIVRIDFTKLGVQALHAVFMRLLTAREWTHAERLIAEAARREDLRVDDYRTFLANEMIEAGDLPRARSHIDAIAPDERYSFELDVTLASDRTRAYDVLVAHVRKALASTEPLDDVELAYDLLRAEPALGILAVRACIGTMHIDDGETLLEAVEEARDKLNLPPTDPAWAVFDELVDDEDSPAKAERIDGRLTESTAKIDELERALAATKAQLADATTRPVAELMRAQPSSGGLDTKVRELEALIREGNAERRELRKQLETREANAAATKREDSPRARRATMDEPDEGFDDALEAGARDVTLPRFERRFVDALGEVPTQVAAETMRTIGTLSAGDGFAWRGVKQAKDMARQVLMARIGIHHRLIFRVEGEEMNVLDLITREQLDTTLRRLRMNR